MTIQPNDLVNHKVILPKPDQNLYSEAERQKDKESFNVTLDDVIEALLKGLSHVDRHSAQREIEGLVDIAVDKLMSANWEDGLKLAKLRLNTLLLMASTFMVEHLHKLSKLGKVQTVENFKPCGKHRYQVDLATTKPGSVDDWLGLSVLHNRTKLNSTAFIQQQIAYLGTDGVTPFEDYRNDGVPRAYHAFHWDYQHEIINHGTLTNRPLYLVDDPNYWSSPHLDGINAQVLTKVCFFLTNPYIIRSAEFCLELQPKSFFEDIEQQGYDAIVYIPRKSSQHDDSRQLMLFNAKHSVLHMQHIPNAGIGMYLDRWLKEHSNQRLVEPTFKKTEVTLPTPSSLDNAIAEFAKAFEKGPFGSKVETSIDQTLRSKEIDIAPTPRPANEVISDFKKVFDEIQKETDPDAASFIGETQTAPAKINETLERIHDALTEFRQANPQLNDTIEVKVDCGDFGFGVF